MVPTFLKDPQSTLIPEKKTLILSWVLASNRYFCTARVNIQSESETAVWIESLFVPITFRRFHFISLGLPGYIEGSRNTYISQHFVKRKSFFCKFQIELCRLLEMEHWTIELRLLIVQIYFNYGKSLAKTLQSLRTILGRQNASSCSSNVINKVEVTGSIVDWKNTKYG